MEKKTVKFFFLSLDVPNHPLFKEQQELSTLPQVSLMSLLKKYDGTTLKEETVRRADGSETTVKCKYTLKKLPKYLFLHVGRFSKNNFFKEKNQSIVNFPIRGLDLTDLVANDSSITSTKPRQVFDLVGTVIHTGKAEGGSYRVMALHEPAQEWHDIQDLLVNEIMP